MILIGLTGRAGCGKDTVAGMLRDNYGFATYSFATPIKLAVNSLLGVEGLEVWDNRKWKETPHPVTGRSPRYMAQTLGTEWGRELVSSTIWIDSAFRQIERTMERHPTLDRWVISDVRFDNEANAIRERGGIVAHIHRPGGADTTKHGDHVSEDGVSVTGHQDWLMLNAGTLEDLLEETVSLAQHAAYFEVAA